MPINTLKGLSLATDVKDVKVDGVSVINNGIASIDLSDKQDKLIPGNNIRIEDGIISAMGTSEFSAGEAISLEDNEISLKYAGPLEVNSEGDLDLSYHHNYFEITSEGLTPVVTEITMGDGLKFDDGELSVLFDGATIIINSEGMLEATAFVPEAEFPLETTSEGKLTLAYNEDFFKVTSEGLEPVLSEIKTEGGIKFENDTLSLDLDEDWLMINSEGKLTVNAKALTKEEILEIWEKVVK